MNHCFPKHIAILHCLAVFCSVGFSQTAEWLEHYPAGGGRPGFRLCQGTNGELYGVTSFRDRVIMADDTLQASATDEDVLVVKWDSTGNLLWSHVIDNSSSYCFPGSGDEVAKLYYHTAHDILFVILNTGCNSPSPPFSYTSWSHLIAYSREGDHLWTRHWSSGQNNTANAGLVFFTDEELIGIYGGSSADVSFTGTTLQIPAGSVVVYYGLNGTFIQAHSLPQYGSSVAQRSDSTILFSLNATPSTIFFGQALPVVASNEGVVLRADTSGSIIWSSFFRSDMDCYVSTTTEAHGLIATIVTFSGDLLVPGEISGVGITPKALAILSALGNVLALIPITSNEISHVLNLRIGSDGSIYLMMSFGSEIQVGNRQFFGQSTRNGLIVRFDSAGECLAGWTFGRISTTIGSVLPIEDGVYVSVGMDSTFTIADEMIPWESSEISKAIFIGKFAAIDGFTNLPAPKAALSHQLLIYANPNDGTCTIELPETLEWTPALMLRIHDSQGRLIQSMPLRKEQGRIAMDIRAQAKGIYPVEVTDGQQRYTGTIVFQ